MCGIAGILNRKGGQADGRAIGGMTNAMTHRGPDADGFFAEGPMALGHRRLSIIDLSEKSNQPIYSADDRYVIVFNGEVYNYAEIKRDLPVYPFKTQGDTEVVLAAFITWGAAALERLKGMFAFAIWDRKEESLFIARDRLGVKPLYYYSGDEYFIFGSEIRSLLQSGLVPRKISREALVDYLSYQSFQSPQTIVEGISELPAGTWMEISGKTTTQNSYWQVVDGYSKQPPQEEALVHKKIRELLLSSVERRLVSDVPVAAFLSGGIDSTVVVGLMAELQRAPEAFTIGFDDTAFDESAFAAQVAKKFGARHHTIILKPEIFLDELPIALDAMDSPSGDGVNTYVVSGAIRKEGIKVAISGVGGDELFAGYPIFRQWQALHARSWLLKTPAALRKIAGRLLNNGDMRNQRLKQLLSMNSFSIASVYPVLRQVNAHATTAAILGIRFSQTQLENTLAALQPKLQQFPLLSQVSIAEYLGYTRQTLLKDTDQMSMAVSLEVREPFFDHDLVSYVLNLPDGLKEGNVAKQLLVKSVAGLVPDQIVNRKKQGFVFPWNQWFRNELKSYCETRIHQLSKREFINGPYLLKYWNDFLEGKNRVRWTNILVLLSLENYISKHNLE